MKSLMKIPVLIITLILAGILSSYNLTNPKFFLTKEEVNSLLFMLEEEKMALDVYTKMSEKWGTQQFKHIQKSERMHLEAITNILEKYNVKYTLLASGKFKNQNLQNLYNELIVQGNQSEVEALKGGAKIEDVDLYDLMRFKKEIKNPEIIKAYNFLECGSRNHLRAFTIALKANQVSYNPEFISQESYETILNNAQERCGQEFSMGPGEGKGKGQGLERGMNCAGGGKK